MAVALFIDNFQTKEHIMAKAILLLIVLCAGLFFLFGGSSWGGPEHYGMSENHQSYSDAIHPTH